MNTTQDTEILSKLYKYDPSSRVFWKMFKGDTRNHFLKKKDIRILKVFCKIPQPLINIIFENTAMIEGRSPNRRSGF